MFWLHNLHLMNILDNFGKNLIGQPAAGQEPLSINRLTLAYTGPLAEYENNYLNDHFLRSLNPLRFALVLSMLFYGGFAYLDALTIPDLKEVFWIIRFGIICPILAAVFVFTYSKKFEKYMQVILACIMLFCWSWDHSNDHSYSRN